MRDVAPSSTVSGATRRESGAVSTWERVSFGLTHAVAAVLLKCLSVEGLYGFGRMFGYLEYLVNFKRRRRFDRALRFVLGRKPSVGEKRRHTREHFQRSRCDKLFYLVFDAISRDKAMSLLVVEHKEVLDAAMARGKGVYLAMSHHGAYHALGMLLAVNGYKTVGVRDRNESALRRYVQQRFETRYPEFNQMRVLYSGDYPREIYRCYKEGYLLGSAMDISRVRDTTQRTEEVTIFGERRAFLSGPMRVAARCGAPVLQGFVVPERGFRYRLDIVDTLLDPDTASDENAAIQAAMQAYAARVESYVRARPSLISRI